MRTHPWILSLLLLALPAAADAQDGRPLAVPFVGLDWRVMGLADHLSHGPGFQVGALLFDHLKVGIAGFARPGPINPAEFDVQLNNGQSYRGKTTLNMRSDGSVVGITLAPRFRMPGAAWLDVELPLLVGYGAFGFYLQGNDRDTPDGRRVSEWEDELLKGADSAAGLAVDAGLRLSVQTAQRWLRPYVGVHHTWLVGYDATLRDNYNGFSGVAGIEVGGF